MKLVFASEFINEDSTAHAFARRARSLARGLAHLGLAVTVVTPEAAGAKTMSVPFEILHLHPPARARSLCSGPLSRAAQSALFALRLARVLRRDKPGRVICSFHDPLLVLLAILAGRVTCGMTNSDVHDSWILLEHHHQGRLRNQVRKMLERISMHLATGVTTVSPTLKDLIVMYYRVPAKKIQVVYGGADLPPVLPPVVKDIDLIHVGSPRVYYDSMAFVEALTVMSKSGFSPSVVFLGSRDDSYVDQVRAKVRELGLEKQVQFLPPVPPDEVQFWLARSKVGVHTMSSDSIYSCSIGVKFFEYIANGLPVAYLGTPGDETARLIVSSGCGRTASTVPEFADALRDLLLDEKKRGVMGAKAREMAKKYSWDESAREMALALGLLHGG